MASKLLTITDLCHYCMYLEKFEKLTFKSLFEYLDEHKLLSEHQSGFRPNDSYTNQLLPIVHDIYMAFNADPTLEVQGVFLDMSKAFDKVWLEGLICKLVCLCLKSINKHVFLVKH